MAITRPRLGLPGSALLAGVVLLVLALYRPLAPLRRALWSPGRAAAPAAAPRAGGPTGPAPAAATAAEEPSELTRGLNDPSSDVRSDLRIVDGLFLAYRGATHRLDPVGENAEVTAALRGRNPLGFAFIPAGCPAVNAKGELCDRWGTPYFFHALAGDRMEIRSAGPDRVLWTADDAVLTP
jgi:hypothetical protein